MPITKAARRYATALLELAQERNEVESILEDIEFIDNTLEGSRELVVFLKSPIIKYDDKIKVLDELFSSKIEEAEMLRAERIEKSKKEADQMIEQARETIEQEKKRALMELRDEVAKLAVQSASKIIDSELDEQKNSKLVDDFIKDISKN